MTEPAVIQRVDLDRQVYRAVGGRFLRGDLAPTTKLIETAGGML